MKNRLSKWEKRNEPRGITKAAIQKVKRTINKAKAEERKTRSVRSAG